MVWKFVLKIEKFNIIGYAVETVLSSNDNDVGLLWGKYKNSLLSLPESKSCLYGVLWYTKNHNYYYLLGIHIGNEDTKLSNTTVVEIPAAYFAIATVF